jgi:hypothetical protein
LRRPTSSRACDEIALASIEAQVPNCSPKSTVHPGLPADWGWLGRFPKSPRSHGPAGSCEMRLHRRP